MNDTLTPTTLIGFNFSVPLRNRKIKIGEFAMFVGMTYKEVSTITKRRRVTLAQADWLVAQAKACLAYKEQCYGKNCGW